MCEPTIEPRGGTRLLTILLLALATDAAQAQQVGPKTVAPAQVAPSAPKGSPPPSIRFQEIAERAGVPLTRVLKPLEAAERRGLITRDHQRIAPTLTGRR